MRLEVAQLDTTRQPRDYPGNFLLLSDYPGFVEAVGVNGELKPQ